MTLDLNILYFICFKMLCSETARIVCCRPLANYNSLRDPHLAGYFANSRLRRQLRKAGLVSTVAAFFCLKINLYYSPSILLKHGHYKQHICPNSCSLLCITS